MKFICDLCLEEKSGNKSTETILLCNFIEYSIFITSEKKFVLIYYVTLL